MRDEDFHALFSSAPALERPMEKPPEIKYLIWSNQHRKWWRAGSVGHTSSLERAGRYTREQAIEHARPHWKAVWRNGLAVPEEIPVLETDAMECAS